MIKKTNDLSIVYSKLLYIYSIFDFDNNLFKYLQIEK